MLLRDKPFEYHLLDECNLKEEYVNNKRFYNVEGELFPSVTTVLSTLSKAGIDEWRRRVGEDEADRIMKQAANRGTRTHLMLEKYLRNDISYAHKALPDAIALFKQIRPWLDRNVDFLYGNEIQLYSRELRTAGRCDAVASVNGRPAIIDFKTSSKEKKKEYINNYFYQVSAYAIMMEEMYGIKVEDAYILIAVEDGQPQSFPIRTKEYKDTVRHIFQTYHLNG